MIYVLTRSNSERSQQATVTDNKANTYYKQNVQDSRNQCNIN